MPLDVIEFPIADTVPSELNTTVMLIELKLKVPLKVLTRQSFQISRRAYKSFPYIIFYVICIPDYPIYII